MKKIKQKQYFKKKWINGFILGLFIGVVFGIVIVNIILKRLI